MNAFLTLSSSRDVKHGLAEADRKPRNLNANAKEGRSSISPLLLLFFCISSLPAWVLSLVTDERPAAKCETPPFQSDAASFPASRGKCSVEFSHRPTGAVYKIIGPEMNYLSVVVSSIPAQSFEGVSCASQRVPRVGQKKKKKKNFKLRRYAVMAAPVSWNRHIVAEWPPFNSVH